MDLFIIVLALLAIVAGLAGLILPVLPALPLVYGGLFLLAYADQFERVGAWTLGILGAVTAVGMLLDFLAGVLGAKYSGASKHALWGAVIGSVIGVFFGLIGLILGPMLGAALGELWARREVFGAGKVAIGTLIGFVLGSLAKIGAALALIFGFALAWLI